MIFNRFMEMHRRDYSEESQRLLKKQQATIDMLIKQNKEIKGEISLITRYSLPSLVIIFS